MTTYAPGKQAGGVGCPILVLVGARTSSPLRSPPAAAAKRAPKGELVEYDEGHFDVYVGDAFERSVSDQIEFYGRALEGTK